VAIMAMGMTSALAASSAAESATAANIASVEMARPGQEEDVTPVHRPPGVQFGPQATRLSRSWRR
jgi:hypothetical protein